MYIHIILKFSLTSLVMYIQIYKISINSILTVIIFILVIYSNV